jgi:hypothetical protein
MTHQGPQRPASPRLRRPILDVAQAPRPPFSLLTVRSLGTEGDRAFLKHRILADLGNRQQKAIQPPAFNDDKLLPASEPTIRRGQTNSNRRMESSG